jgi:hypothetical protein
VWIGEEGFVLEHACSIHQAEQPQNQIAKASVLVLDWPK